MITPAAPQLKPVITTPMPQVPREPAVPQALLDLASTPLVRGEYRGTERATVREGLPIFGTKGTSTRQVSFSNEFNILKTSGPMISYAAATLDDAVRAASRLAFDWSDPSLGGAIGASVGVAVLKASDNAYFTALIGSGNPQTSDSALGYRSDRFDNNIYGSIKRSTDARPESDWTAPVDRRGNPVSIPPPANDRPISPGRVKDITIEKFVPASPMVQAVLDINRLYKVIGAEDPTTKS